MSAEKILTIGGGGREHALGEAINEPDRTLFFAPGNAGTALMPNGVNIDVAFGDLPTFAKENGVGLTIVGPEAPLVKGITNMFDAEGLPILGPSQEASMLEASKIEATEFMERNGIPHPESIVVRSIYEMPEGLDPHKVVLKADGLAGGKGVVLPNSKQEMMNVLHDMLSGNSYDKAGEKGVLIQERLHGPEVSVFAVCDGTNYTILEMSQDHKRLGDGDEGPNTGGMGAYSPVPESIVNEDQKAKLIDIIDKTVKGMAEEGKPYKGFLYLGAMLAEERDGDPVVIEYNVRFGDPEAQVVLRPGMFDLFMSAVNGELDPNWTMPESRLGKAALTVCLAGPDYPDSGSKGVEIHGLDDYHEGVRIHHGGTKLQGEKVVTNGGRVIYVTGYGEDIDQAASRAYSAIGQGPNDGKVFFDGMQHRTDIGYQARGAS